jgi:hypothetical protein
VHQQAPLHQLAILGCVFSFGVKWGSSLFTTDHCIFLFLGLFLVVFYWT